jgi:hypothetical protein
MENLKITKRFTKRVEGWESQLIIKRKGEDIETINEESEKIFNSIKKNAPACMKRAMKDLDNEE